MEPFIVVSAADDKVQVPFTIPNRDGGDPFTFTIPRLNFIDEDAARKMKKNLLDLEREVPQIDPVTDAPIYEKDDDGNVKMDGDGNPIPMMGAPQLSYHEKTRAMAEAMLGPVLPPAIFRRVQKLTVGELDQIVAHWTKVSTSPLDGVEPGESSASSTS